MEQQYEANEAMESRTVCGAATEVSGVKCSGGRRSTLAGDWWFVPVRGKEEVFACI